MRRYAAAKIRTALLHAAIIMLGLASLVASGCMIRIA